jgi:hypothetical protein
MASRKAVVMEDVKTMAPKIHKVELHLIFSPSAFGLPFSFDQCVDSLG